MIIFFIYFKIHRFREMMKKVFYISDHESCEEYSILFKNWVGSTKVNFFKVRWKVSFSLNGKNIPQGCW